MFLVNNENMGLCLCIPRRFGLLWIFGPESGYQTNVQSPILVTRNTICYPWFTREHIIIPLDWHLVVYPRGAGEDKGAGLDEEDLFYTGLLSSRPASSPPVNIN